MEPQTSQDSTIADVLSFYLTYYYNTELESIFGAPSLVLSYFALSFVYYRLLIAFPLYTRVYNSSSTIRNIW